MLYIFIYFCDYLPVLPHQPLSQNTEYIAHGRNPAAPDMLSESQNIIKTLFNWLTTVLTPTQSRITAQIFTQLIFVGKLALQSLTVQEQHDRHVQLDGSQSDHNDRWKIGWLDDKQDNQTDIIKHNKKGAEWNKFLQIK